MDSCCTWAHQSGCSLDVGTSIQILAWHPEGLWISRHPLGCLLDVEVAYQMIVGHPDTLLNAYSRYLSCLQSHLNACLTFGWCLDTHMTSDTCQDVHQMSGHVWMLTRHLDTWMDVHHISRYLSGCLFDVWTPSTHQRSWHPSRCLFDFQTPVLTLVIHLDIHMNVH